jgi:hypothetical protein
MRSPDGLRPHPKSREMYGPPTANSEYKDIKWSMDRNGYDERWPLLITEDGRVLWGATRHAVAKSLGVEGVPCLVYHPKDPATAELEYEEQVVLGNVSRKKTQLMIVREQRTLMEVERALAKHRMGAGGDGKESRATDRVGQHFRKSGKTVGREIKILEAIEAAQADGQAKQAEKLTELLNAGKTVQALALLDKKGPARKKKPVKVEVPRTLHDHVCKAYSEFFEACCKARVLAEVEVVEATLGRMRDDLEAARKKLDPAAAKKVNA